MSDSTAMRVEKTLPVGHELLWYTIESVLGQGGFGITYLAQDRNLGRKVALKEYLPLMFASRASDYTVAPLGAEHEESYRWGLESFMNEARTLAQFKHPNIVQVQTVFEEHGTAYMAMEYEQGNSLIDFIKRKGTVPDQRFCEGILFPIMDGLQLVHDAGFVHRDIKPANIYLRTDGSPVLIDFGSSREVSRQDASEMTALISEGYTPIEQYSADNQGPWTDVYALAASIYHAVSGKKTVDSLHRNVLVDSGKPDPLKPLAALTGPEFDTEFVCAIDEGLRLKAEDRPRSLREWRAAFEQNIDDITVFNSALIATANALGEGVRPASEPKPAAAPEPPRPVDSALPDKPTASQKPASPGPGGAQSPSRPAKAQTLDATPVAQSNTRRPLIAAAAAVAVALLALGGWLVGTRGGQEADMSEAIATAANTAGNAGTGAVTGSATAASGVAEPGGNTLTAAMLQALPAPPADIAIASPLARVTDELRLLEELNGIYVQSLAIDATSERALLGQSDVTARYVSLASQPLVQANAALHARVADGLRAGSSVSPRAEAALAALSIDPGDDAQDSLRTLLSGASTIEQRTRALYTLTGLSDTASQELAANPRLADLTERFGLAIVAQIADGEPVRAARMLELALLVAPADEQLSLLRRFLEGGLAPGSDGG